MEDITNALRTIGKLQPHNLSVYLEALNERQSLRLQHGAGCELARNITSMLGTSATRSQGMLILQSYLQQCPLEVLNTNVKTWMTLILKNVDVNKNPDQVIYSILRELAIKCKLDPHCPAVFTGEDLRRINNGLETAQPPAYLSVLRYLEVSLRLYPEQNVHLSRAALEAFLSKFLDESNEEHVHLASKCFHLLQITSSGANKRNPKEAWEKYQVQLLGSLHDVLDNLLVHCSELYDEPAVKDQLNIALPDLSEEPIAKSMQLFRRFVNLLEFLISALREPCAIAKNVAPKKILNFIVRGLDVTCPMLEKNRTIENTIISAFWPLMQVKLYELMQVLMSVLKSYLARYHAFILNSIAHTLKWTSTSCSGSQKPYTTLRSAAYATLSLWCSIMNHGSRSEIIANDVLQEIFLDITQYEGICTLTVLGKHKKQMSKKAKKLWNKTSNEATHLAKKFSNLNDNQTLKYVHNEDKNQPLCIAALQCLQNIFVSAGPFLQPATIQIAFAKVTSLCLSLMEVIHPETKLYSSPLCRMELYNALHSFVLSPHHLCPPPTQVIVKLLQYGQIHDKCDKVRINCSHILNSIEKVIHPQKESLVFPPDARKIRDALQKCLQGNLRERKDAGEDSEDLDDEMEMTPEAAVNLEDVSDDISDIEGRPTDVIDLDEDAADQMPKSPQLEETDANAIDLTEDDSELPCRRQSISSDDSVTFVSEKEKQSDQGRKSRQPRSRSQRQGSLSGSNEPTEMIELSNSPDLTLHVDDDDDDDDDVEEVLPVFDVEKDSDDDVQETQNVEENGEPTNNQANKRQQDEPSESNDQLSLSKRIRLVTPDSTASVNIADNGDEQQQAESDPLTFEDIAADFVDEIV